MGVSFVLTSFYSVKILSINVASEYSFTEVNINIMHFYQSNPDLIYYWRGAYSLVIRFNFPLLLIVFFN
jgi:hypothetical protein